MLRGGVLRVTFCKLCLLQNLMTALWMICFHGGKGPWHPVNVLDPDGTACRYHQMQDLFEIPWAAINQG